MTFVLNSNLTVTIPNQQLVVPDVRIADDGTLEIEKPDEREILIYATGDDTNADDMLLLGQPFLSALYLHVNNDDMTFTLWQANPTTDEKLVAAGIACAISATTSTAKTSASPSSSPSTASPLTRLPHRLSDGGIAAVTIGALVCLTVSLLILLWWRKRTQKHRTQVVGLPYNRSSKAFDTYKEMIHESSAESTPQHPSGASGGTQELDWRPVYEMAGKRTSSYRVEVGDGRRSLHPSPSLGSGPPVPPKDGRER
jgi:hypothetical protein